jgi:hypothetical protein
VPISKGGNLTAIVRAIDKAGNVRDESIDVKPPFIAGKFIQDYLVYILILIILLGMVVLVTHYLLGHHIIRYVKRVMQMMKREELADEAHEISPEIKAVEAVPEPPSAPLQNTVTIPKPPMEVMEIPKDPNQSNT